MYLEGRVRVWDENSGRGRKWKCELKDINRGQGPVSCSKSSHSCVRARAHVCVCVCVCSFVDGYKNITFIYLAPVTSCNPPSHNMCNMHTSFLYPVFIFFPHGTIFFLCGSFLINIKKIFRYKNQIHIHN